MRIRDATERDVPACRRIYRRAVLDGTAPHYTAAQAAAWVGDGMLEAGRIAGRARIAEIDAPAGFISVHEGHLDLFFVLPETRRHGVAAALYEDALSRQVLETTYASRLARRFLERRGWVVTGREETPRNGEILERFAMRLRASGRSR